MPNPVILANTGIKLLRPLVVDATELTLLVDVRIPLLVLIPEEMEGHSPFLELLVEVLHGRPHPDQGEGTSQIPPSEHDPDSHELCFDRSSNFDRESPYPDPSAIPLTVSSSDPTYKQGRFTLTGA